MSSNRLLPPANDMPPSIGAGRRSFTLRTKLIAGFVAAIIAVSTVIGVVTQVFLSDFLIGQLDKQVQSTTKRLGDPPPNATPMGTPPPDGHFPEPSEQLCSSINNGFGSGRQPDDSIFAVLTTNTSGSTIQAAVRGQFPSCNELPDGDAEPLRSVPTDGTIVTVSLGDSGKYRVIAMPRDNGAVIISGLSTASVDATQERLLIILVIVVGATVLVGAFVVWLVVRRSLRPLEQVAATARAVAELPLHDGEVDLTVRVPAGLTDPRTEVGQVGAALDQMLVHVDNALTARQQSESRVRQFVADASHELRTPLTAIRGYAELAGRNPDDLPAVRHALGRVRSESERMTTLVDDLLLLARLDSGRPIERAEVDLSQLVVDAVSDARVAGPEHRWQLALPGDPITVVGHTQQLHQVLSNLLANARIHTAPGSTVVTSLTAETGWAVLTVTDNGTGISSELKNEIFERFVRGEQSRSRTAGSTGLGLAIVAAIIAAHHGTVAVDSEPGWTAFTVRLPQEPRGSGTD